VYTFAEQRGFYTTMPRLLPFLAVAALYAGLAVYFWRRTWLLGHALGARLPLNAQRQALHRVILFLPLAAHAWLLQATLASPAGLNFGFANAASAIAWLALATYWLVNLRARMDGMLALVLPIAAVSVPLPALLPSSHYLSHAELPLFRVHLAISMLAYSLLSLAALHALLMAFVERRLHDKAVPPALNGMPPLLTLERLLFQVIGIGFTLLTLTLLSGILFSEELFGRPLQFTHKALFGIVSWATFATLLMGRHLYGWRGRTAIRWTLAGFVLLALAYFGSKFVLEILLGRA
jgi:ABC-type uncharacterized transport system permease subunit